MFTYAFEETTWPVSVTHRRHFNYFTFQKQSGTVCLLLWRLPHGDLADNCTNRSNRRRSIYSNEAWKQLNFNYLKTYYNVVKNDLDRIYLKLNENEINCDVTTDCHDYFKYWFTAHLKKNIFVLSTRSSFRKFNK